MSDYFFSIVKNALKKEKLSKCPNTPEIIYFIRGMATVTVNNNVFPCRGHSFLAVNAQSTYLIESDDCELFVLPLKEDESLVFNKPISEKVPALYDALELSYLNYYGSANDEYYQHISNECSSIIERILSDYFNEVEIEI